MVATKDTKITNGDFWSGGGGSGGCFSVASVGMLPVPMLPITNWYWALGLGFKCCYRNDIYAVLAPIGGRCKPHDNNQSTRCASTGRHLCGDFLESIGGCLFLVDALTKYLTEITLRLRYIIPHLDTQRNTLFGKIRYFHLEEFRTAICIF